MKKKLIFNTITSLIYNMVTIICGLILPRIVLGKYGSEVNGLIDSVTQFLGFITFLELGIGAVVRSTLYKPIAEKNDVEMSKVLVSASKFFKHIGRVLLIYVLVLIFVYPMVVSSSFSFQYIALMIIILSIGSFAQYYFGIVNGLLLAADQRGYIQYITQIFAVLLNAFSTIILVWLNFGIHIVKLFTALIYLLQPLVMNIYVNRNYRINWKTVCQEEPITQKWNGIAQHIATIILTGTDSMLLTVFASLTDVSIYSVYYKVVNGITLLINALTSGIQSILGDLWAKNDKKKLYEVFILTEWSLHMIVTLVFTVTAILIVPFISVYTNGINDANYIQPTFSLLLVYACAGMCYRLPYNLMILAAGDYKNTQKGFVNAALINVVSSIIFLKIFGLIGVALGTIFAVGYQTIWMAIYSSKHLLAGTLFETIKLIFIDFGIIIIVFVLTKNFKLSDLTYVCWTILAMKVFGVGFIVTLIANFIFYKKNILTIINSILNSIKKQK